MNMNNLYIFILLSIIIIVHFFSTTREGFTTKPQTIILLGDSILKNDIYVELSVEDMLKKQVDCDIVSLARDKTTVVDVYKQIDNIHEGLNRPSTLIFLSVGGNDIIENYIDGPMDVTKNKDYINKIFESYQLLIKSLQVKADKSRIFLLDIYYPKDKKYETYYPLIDIWNKKQREYVDKSNIEGIVKISDKLTQPEDFVFSIEPSVRGGKKIADAIAVNCK